MNYLSIKNKTRMSLLEIETFPFTKDLLKTKYREKAKIYHPDKGGDEFTFVLINEAFNSLLKITENICRSKNKCTYNGYLGSRIVSNNKDHRKDEIYEKCNCCKGLGNKSEMTDESEMKICLKCNGKGYVTLVCNKCIKGKYTLINKRVVDCRVCKGTGIFKKSIWCKNCNSLGWLFGERKEKPTKVECPKCRGKGEIKITPFNPILRPSTLT